MSKIISTYFYHDSEEKGATYGNIFLKLDQRNLVYWQTVYTFFFTSIIHNNHITDVKYVLFTNVENFPLRNKIENLGVIIFHDITLTKRNESKWATVNFFFDVILYIQNNIFFLEEDIVLMLDTDCLAINSADYLFSKMTCEENQYVHLIGKVKDINDFFHGISFDNLEKAYYNVFNSKVTLTETVGGEFFLFKKNNISNFISQYIFFSNSTFGQRISTEEQILTLFNVDLNFKKYPKSIYRIWTTYKCIDIPFDFKNYVFLHLPSEKTYGLKRLYKILSHQHPSNYTKSSLNKVIFEKIPLGNIIQLYYLKFFSDFRTKLGSVFNK